MLVLYCHSAHALVGPQMAVSAMEVPKYHHKDAVPCLDPF